MHFSIPETESRSGDSGGSTYVAYNIHVNGVLHCRVRYSQLLGLHEQLRKEYGANVLPAFPPKKLFSLTPAEVEQRREQLEKYMQAVRQDPLLGSSETFNSFLRRAQQETQQVPTEEVSLEVLLSDGQKVLVNVLTSDQTEDVLEAVAAKLDLPDDLIGYFSLFLVREKKMAPFLLYGSFRSLSCLTYLSPVFGVKSIRSCSERVTGTLPMTTMSWRTGLA